MPLNAEWADEICLAWTHNCPAYLLEHLMANEQCVAFGPIHHYLVGASLLACMRENLPVSLEYALKALSERSDNIPGAACARWGICGAAASCGMAFAIAAENAPLKTQGWSEGQAMVAEILARIAQSGAPRCCKRDSRIAVRTATIWLNRYFDTQLQQASQSPACAATEFNSACIKEACPYYSAD